MTLLNTSNHTTRTRCTKGAPGTSGSPETPESKWKHETLYVVLVSVINSTRSRFEKNRPLYEMLSVISPNCFPHLSEMYKTVYDLTLAFVKNTILIPRDVQKDFSVLHGPAVNFIAPNWYAHKRMITILEDDIEQDHDEKDADENYDDSIELSDNLKMDI